MDITSFTTDFKSVMHDGMLENFRKSGFLQPLAYFLYKNGDTTFPHGLRLVPLTGDFMGDFEYKKEIAEKIRKICESPFVIAAGIITEAYAAKISIADENSTKLLNGEIRVRELNQKEDIIIMVFNTRICEEIIAYVVDVKNKTIGEKYPETSYYSGVFSGFFGWNKN